MPLFTNHETMQIDTQRVCCPEPECPCSLPAPRQCQHGQNRGKWYTVCYNESHGHRFKFWDLGTFPASPTAQCPRGPRVPSNTTQQLLVTGLEEAATALPAPCRHVSELHHQHLAQEQEAAAHLAALTPFLPSLTLSQEAHNQVFAVSIALGTLPPLLVMSQPTRCVILIIINAPLHS
ncbi:hypothetical protein B0H14DRAFT_2642246 [Mycena olivaceomarginata]|nr:hypothetical protein B0H14DRAFT_2642246 [Mycena olivaceomarginata]